MASFPPQKQGGITFATVCMMAQQNGAVLSERQSNTIKPIDMYPTFDAAMQQLRQNKADKIAFDAAIEHLSNAHIIDSKTWGEELKLVTGITAQSINKAVKVMLSSKNLTHEQLSKSYMESCETKNIIASLGYFWIYEQPNGIWEKLPISKIKLSIASKFTTQPLCKTDSHYNGIAKLTYERQEDVEFFASARKGISTPDGFYTVEEDELVCLTHEPEFRSRFKTALSPEKNGSISEFLNMLKSAFGDTYDDQCKQLQQFLGLAILGLQSTEQRACLLVGAGGSGKSTILKIIEAIIPKEYIANVSPLDFDNEYQRANLAGKLLNLVPEIDKAKPIPSDYFKSLVSADTVNAREVYGLVFSFRPEAGNWFNGNFEPTTRDHSEGFFRRWAVFEFFHGKSDLERDPLLLKRILNNELGGILNWAFEGAKDYLNDGLYLSNTHYAFIAKWKKEANSVLSWLNDADDLHKRTDKSHLPLKATEAYNKYKCWCAQSYRKAYSKKEFYSYMANAGYAASNSNGFKVFLDFDAARMFIPVRPLQQVS